MKLKGLLNSIFMMILLFGGVLFFTGCNRDQEVVSSVAEQSIDQRIIDMVQKATNDPILQKEMQEELQFLVKYNYVQIDDVVIEFNGIPHINDYIYVSQGDIMRTREQVKVFMQENKENPSVSLRSHRGDGSVSSPIFVNDGTYTVYVHSGVPSVWVTAVSQAISAWNGLNLDVKFGGASTGNLSNPGAITVYMSTAAGSAYARALTPSGGFPGSQLQIHPTNGNSLSASKKKLVIAHELGHTIGFLHTDTSDGHALISTNYGCISSSCNGTDVSSVMRNTLPVPSWAGFSTCDQNVFQCIY